VNSLRPTPHGYVMTGTLSFETFRAQDGEKGTPRLVLESWNASESSSVCTRMWMG
jgi:hypothetical protein